MALFSGVACCWPSCLATWVSVASAVLRLASVAVGGAGTTIAYLINSNDFIQGKYSVVVFSTGVIIGVCVFGVSLVLID